MLQRRLLLLVLAASFLRIDMVEFAGEVKASSNDKERYLHCAFVYHVTSSFREIFKELKAANRRCNGSSFSTWIARLAGECDADKMLERDNEMEGLARTILVLESESDKCAGAGFE